MLRFGKAVARWLIGTRFSIRGRTLGGSDRHDVIEESVQSLAVATVGANSFRGHSDGEAFEWCRIVLMRKIQAELERRMRVKGVSREAFPRTLAASNFAEFSEAFESPPEELPIDLPELLRTVHDEIGRSHAPRYATDLAEAAFDWFATILGTAQLQEIQLRVEPCPRANAASLLPERSAAARRKRRQRGREAAKAAVASLQERGKLTSRQLLAARMFGLADTDG